MRERDGDAVGFDDWRKRHQHDAICKLATQLRGDLQREPGLADTTGAGQRHEPYASLGKQCPYVYNLLRAAEQRRGRRREAISPATKRGKWRKASRQIRHIDLEDPLRMEQLG